MQPPGIDETPGAAPSRLASPGPDPSGWGPAGGPPQGGAPLGLSGPVELSMRPRPTLIALLCAASIGLPVLLLWLSWSEAVFDARIPLFAIEMILFTTVAFRARITVADRTLRRRGLKMATVAGVVSLDRLAKVEVGRARYLRNQGLMHTRLVVADRDGRQIALKPALWQKGSAPLMALLETCARSQGLALDDETAAHLSAASQVFGQDVPAWAYAGTSATEFQPGAGPVPVARSSAWTRRDADGRPLRMQAQRIPILLAVFAVLLPVVFVTTKVGTTAVRSARCDSDRHLWGPAAEVGATATPFVSLVETMPSAATFAGAQVRIYRLDRSRMYNSNASAAMKAAAGRLLAGADVGWTANNQRTSVADVLVEEFPSADAAFAYQQDWGEEHCHQGDLAFAPSGIAGATGFRCRCGSTVDDRIAFLRGPIRIQATYWRVQGNGHGVAETLARSADRLAGPPLTPLAAQPS